MIKTLFKYTPVVVSYLEILGNDEQISNDLYCTALARSIKEGAKIVIDKRRHACAGGNYFVGGDNVSEKNIADVYVNKEFVLANDIVADQFIKKVVRNVKQSRYILFEPIKSESKPGDESVAIGISTSDNVGRILGLCAYNGNFDVDVVPAASTCASIYRPLVLENVIHLNFIDYFDRQYQCKGFYEKNEIIVSMTYKMFKQLSTAYSKSSHGSRKPMDVPIYNVKKLKSG